MMVDFSDIYSFPDYKNFKMYPCLYYKYLEYLYERRIDQVQSPLIIDSPNLNYDDDSKKINILKLLRSNIDGNTIQFLSDGIYSDGGKGYEPDNVSITLDDNSKLKAKISTTK